MTERLEYSDDHFPSLTELRWQVHRFLDGGSPREETAEFVSTPSILRTLLEHPQLPDPEIEHFQPHPLHILDIHFKNGRTDGVSLVAQNQAVALGNQYGPEDGLAYYFAGATIPGPKKREQMVEAGVPVDRGLILPELGYQSEELAARRQRLYPNAEQLRLLQEEGRLEAEEQALLGEIYNDAVKVYAEVRKYVLSHEIGTVVIRNIMSMALNPAATLGLYWLIQDSLLSGVQFQLMHHDLYDEPVRAHKYQTPFTTIAALQQELYPPVFDQKINVSHACLNAHAQQQLKDEKGIDATIVPDSVPFADFEHLIDRTWETPLPEGEYDWRSFFGLGEHDFAVYVPTRVTDRKAISFAVQIVGQLQQERERLIAASAQNGGVGRFARPFTNESRLVLCLPQYEDTIDNQELIVALKEMATAQGVDIRFASDIVQQKASELGIEGNDPSALSSAINEQSANSMPSTQDFTAMYGQGDLPLFPSIQEGFGNQLLEIMASSNLAIVSEYPNLEGVLRDLDVDVRMASYAPNANPRIDIIEPKGNFAGVETAHGPLWLLEPAAVSRITQEILALLSMPPNQLKLQLLERREKAKQRFDLTPVAEQFKAALPFGLPSN